MKSDITFKKAIDNAWHRYIYQHLKNGADIKEIPPTKLHDLLCRACDSTIGEQTQAYELSPQEYFELIKWYHQAGASVNITPYSLDDRKISPLQWAIQGGNDDVVLYLLDNGADIYYRDVHGNFPLLDCIRAEKYQYFPYLEKDIEGICSPQVWETLYYNLISCSPEQLPTVLDVLKRFVSLGANPNQQLPHRASMLLALVNGDVDFLPIHSEMIIEVAKVLLDHRANPNHVDSHRYSVFDYAEKYNPSLYQLLPTYAERQPRPLAPEELEKQKLEAFNIQSASMMNTEFITKLVKQKNDLYTYQLLIPKIVSENRQDLLQAAFDAGMPADIIFSSPKDAPYDLGFKHANLIYIATVYNNIDLVKFFVNKGVNPFFPLENYGYNALSKALRKHNKELVLYLLSLSSDPVKDWEIETKECPEGNGPGLNDVLWDLELTKMFIEQLGIHPSQLWDRTCGPIHNALYRPDIVEYLLSQGSDIEDPDYEESDLTPFGVAIKRGLFKTMEVIHKYNPKIHPDTLYTVYKHENEQVQVKILKKLYKLGVDLKQSNDLLMFESIIHETWYENDPRRSETLCRDYLFSLFGREAHTWHIRCWCALNDIEKVTKLFNPDDPNNGDLIHIAILNNNKEMLQLLLELGVPANGKGKAYDPSEEQYADLYYKPHLQFAINKGRNNLASLLSECMSSTST